LALLDVLDKLFDVLYAPLLSLSPLVGLTIISLALGAFTLLIFRLASHSGKRLAISEEIRTLRMEVRLYREDSRRTLRLLGRLMALELRSMRHSLIPAFACIVPALIILAQTEPFFRAYPVRLRPGETVLVMAESDTSESNAPKELELIPSGGLEVLEEFRKDGAWGWRLTALEVGRHPFRIRSGSQVAAHEVMAGYHLARLSPVREKDNFLHLKKNSLPPDGALARIGVLYHPIRPLGDMGGNWLFYVLGVSILFGLLLKRVFGFV